MGRWLRIERPLTGLPLVWAWSILRGYAQFQTWRRRRQLSSSESNKSPRPKGEAPTRGIAQPYSQPNGGA
jgi:hypothetical protein